MQAAASSYDPDDIENEPPLLEELGINFEHIRLKTLAVLNPLASATSADVIADQDLAGPLVFCLLFGAALLLHGKVHFGYIYGIGAGVCARIQHRRRRARLFRHVRTTQRFGFTTD
jgi:hypothetical protein